MERVEPVKNNSIGIPKVIQKMLCFIGYHLPQQFHKPHRSAYIYSYIILATLVTYMGLTIWDISCMALDAFRTYALCLLSTATIVATQAYKISIGKRKETHIKNRRHINKISKKLCVFSEKVYKRPMVLELIFVVFAIILMLGMIILYSDTKNIVIARQIGCVLRLVLIFLSIVNCAVLCVENFAQFYEATDTIV